MFLLVKSIRNYKPTRRRKKKMKISSSRNWRELLGCNVDPTILPDCVREIFLTPPECAISRIIDKSIPDDSIYTLLHKRNSELRNNNRKSINIFVSQAMSGLDDAAIRSANAEARQIFTNLYNRIPDDEKLTVKFIESYDPSPYDGSDELVTEALFYLGRSVKFLAQADVCLTVGDISSARGCKAEEFIASTYGLLVLNTLDIQRDSEYLHEVFKDEKAYADELAKLTFTRNEATEYCRGAAKEKLDRLCRDYEQFIHTFNLQLDEFYNKEDGKDEDE